MNPRRTIGFVIALALACLLVAGYKWSAARHATSATTLPVPACNPGERDCRVALPAGGHLTLSITPRPILSLQTLNLSVAFSDGRADLVEIDFDGADMSMGYNRPRLAVQGEKFTGSTILPVCITGTMTWKATVLASIDGERIAIPFLFEVAGR